MKPRIQIVYTNRRNEFVAGREVPGQQLRSDGALLLDRCGAIVARLNTGTGLGVTIGCQDDEYFERIR